MHEAFKTELEECKDERREEFRSIYLKERRSNYAKVTFEEKDS